MKNTSDKGKLYPARSPALDHPQKTPKNFGTKMIAKILVIDHDITRRSSLVRLASKICYEFQEGSNARELFSAVVENPPDLILLDLLTLGPQTAKYCQRLQADERTKPIPIILVSNGTGHQQLIDALEVGATDHISRPISQVILKARITAALNSKAKHDELIAQQHENRHLQIELKTKSSTLARSALHDGLTGLPNRALLMDRLNLAIERSRRDPEFKFAVLFVDFDRFKAINDSLGHEAGDQLLMGVAERMQTELRSVDMVSSLGGNNLPSRLGGDEFVILLDSIKDRDDAEKVADRLQAALSVPYHLLGHQVTATASIGIVTNEKTYDSASDMIRDADTAMYQAKADGRSRNVLFNNKMHEDLVTRLSLERLLQDAVEQQQLTIHYQPIYCLKDTSLAGVEAMVRWPREGQKTLVSAQFMTLADESGLIVPMGSIVLRESCRQIGEWKKHFGDQAPKSITVNLWKKQLLQPDLIEVVKDSISEAEIEPSTLTLDIPEQVLLDGLEQMRPVIEQLRQTGVRLSMDGCGKGHSALTFLHKIPIDVMKIDPSITLNIDAQMEYAAIVEAMINLAHNLKMGVVAVGIEKADQLAQLQAFECDWGQGCYLSEALTVTQFESFIQEQPFDARPA